VRGGLSRWARVEVPPVRWPTVARHVPRCLRSHRETFPVVGVSG